MYLREETNGERKNSLVGLAWALPCVILSACVALGCWHCENLGTPPRKGRVCCEILSAYGGLSEYGLLFSLNKKSGCVLWFPPSIFLSSRGTILSLWVLSLCSLRIFAKWWQYFKITYLLFMRERKETEYHPGSSAVDPSPGRKKPPRCSFISIPDRS